MLKLEHLAWKLPTGEEIIKDIDLTIPDNKLVVITGPNGGGKTTTAKMIMGIVTPDSGRIFLDGEDITDCDITERAQKGIAFAFQQPVRFKGLTVRDMLEMASGKNLAEESACAYLSNVGLCASEYIDREMDTSLSGGEVKRIEIATALARKAKLSIFDEPEAGIDLWSFARLVETFEDLKQNHNGTLLIISHQERILSIADEIIVVADGEIVQQGPKDEVLPTLLAGTMMPCCPLGGKGGMFNE